MDKKYYWLKLPEDFFSDKRIKKLRSIAGGDTYTIIYQKMLLASLKFDGRLIFEGIEDSVAEEIALEIDEDPDNVSVTLQFLAKTGLIEVIDEEFNQGAVLMHQVPEMIGSETESARKKRAYRQKKDNVGQLEDNVQKCPTEIEIEIEIDKEIEIERDSNAHARTREAVREFVKAEGLKINADRFFDFYQAAGWIDGCGRKITDWKAMARTWDANEVSRSSPKGKTSFANFGQDGSSGSWSTFTKMQAEKEGRHAGPD